MHTFTRAPAHAAPPLAGDLASPSLADVWSDLAAGAVVGASAEQPRIRPRPWADPVEWLLVKHVVQLALVASVVLLVLQGGRSPLMSLAYVATALLLMVVVVLADRQRFRDRDPAFEIVELVAPAAPPAVTRRPVVQPGPLAPLMRQMHEALGAPVDVT